MPVLAKIRVVHAGKWRIGRRRRLPELLQMDATECGAACLAMILNYYGCKASIAEIRERCGVGRDGLSALTIVQAARNYGMRVRAISLEENDLRFVALPAIVHWGFNHFVVVEHWSPKQVDIVDPACGRRRMPGSEFDIEFTGVVLILEPGEHFERERKAQQFSLAAYLQQIFRLPGFILQILAASLLLQVFGLGMPFLTGFFVDQIIPNGMKTVMFLLGAGILLIVVVQAVTMLLRASLLVYFQAKVDQQMMLGFFEHLLTLPYHFFQQRSSGDLLSRLNSNIAIRDTLTNRMISTLLDGCTVVVYLVILLHSSLIIALSVLVIGLLQIGMLLLSTRTIHELTKRDLVAQGKSQGYMAEALMGIATLKSSGMEYRALQRWSNLFFDHLNVSVRRDYLSAVLSTGMGALQIMAPLFLLWLGTWQVLNGAMSVGTMLALNALAASFLAPLSSLATSGQQLQLVRAHFERITDVVGAEPEQDLSAVRQPPRLSGAIDLQHVSFRYDANASLVLQDINICVQPGQKIALVGRTGSGKSTLGKLLLGLYVPTQGKILYDGLSLQELDYRAVRSQFGVVMQEAALFNDSIRNNISFNDPSINVEKVVKAAQVASLHEEILRMPMGYETLIAESGNALSGGQRQRLALARALVHQPVILLLDEATSHLDMLTEQVIEQHLNSLSCTRIIIAHRLSTIRNADLILVIDEGAIVEQGTHDELIKQDGYYIKLIQSQLEKEEIKML